MRRGARGRSTAGILSSVTETYVPTKPQYARRFDWDQALAMYDDGFTIAEVASEMGVTNNAIWRIVHHTKEERRILNAARGQRYKDYCECGRKKARKSTHCDRCAPYHATTTLRVVLCSDALFWPQLWCSSCKEWKWVPEFTRSVRRAVGRMGRRRTCRACDTRIRREYRNRTKVPCDICGEPRLSDAEKTPGLRRGEQQRLWPFCNECLLHSDDPRAVEARVAVRKLADETLASREA